MEEIETERNKIEENNKMIAPRQIPKLDTSTLSRTKAHEMEEIVNRKRPSHQELP